VFKRTALPIPASIDADAFWSRVQPTGFCWNWTGAKGAGYGVIGHKGKQYRAHRVAYTLLVGVIPDGLDIDHLCRNTKCVNPDHLEPVETKVNTLRGFGAHARNARKTYCDSGHEFNDKNVRMIEGRRVCIECARSYHREYERDRYRSDRERFAAKARERRAANREEYNRQARERRARKKAEAA